MTTDNDVKEAERTFLVKLFVALSDKRVLGALIAALIALCGLLASKAQSKAYPQSALDAASGSWVCTGCTPNKPPSPPPTPIATGGSAGTGGASATGGNAATGGTSAAGVVQFPTCPQGLQATHYSASQVEKWKRTLGPKLQPHPARLLDQDAGSTSKLVKSFFRSLLAHAFNQGSLGSCTENAMVGVVTSKPFALTNLTEADAVKGYSYATTIDPFSGSYPPTDTGSDGASACKALVHFGWAKSCFPTHYSLNKAATQLQTQGITWGVNWHSDSYQLKSCGELAITGSIDGGHQTALVGVDPVYLPSGSIDTENSYIWGLNSWGDQWGLCIDQHCGYYRVRWKNVQTLINEGAVFDGPNLE